MNLFQNAIPRSEYPRPQFIRVDAQHNPRWLCLNGAWQFEIDLGDSGFERGLGKTSTLLAHRITVPFCPESPLSGIGNTDFLHAVWYKREVTIPQEWTDSDVLLHFGAVDYDTTVWIGAKEVGRHRGGFTPFTCDLTGLATAGETITICVRARDEARDPKPRGKQSTQYAPYSCFYTRTTGIWQTVWLEPIPARGALKGRPRITPDLGTGAFHLEVPVTQNHSGWHVRAVLREGSRVITEATVRADLDLTPRLTLSIPATDRRVWSTTDPFLYDIDVIFSDAAGAEVDRLQCYAGLRSIAIEGKKIKINGETIFQRLVLDQGYYPDGVLTAPTDEALIKDIQISMEAGFNGARLHQKIFEERFLYHADRMGYLVWGEFPDWGISGHGAWNDHQRTDITFAAQWMEAVIRDYSHPSIIGWCALNETWQALHDRIVTLDDATRALFLAAKAADGTRPVLDASGYSHRVPETDVYDCHDYITEEDFNKGFVRFVERHAKLGENVAFTNPHPNYEKPKEKPTVWSTAYRGQPYWVSEFGGFKWNPAAPHKSSFDNFAEPQESWGYGADPESLDEFYHRFELVCKTLLDNPSMFGYCYTQLTDVFPEENGIVTFDRQAKFDTARLKAIQERIAAIEEAG